MTPEIYYMFLEMFLCQFGQPLRGIAYTADDRPHRCSIEEVTTSIVRELRKKGKFNLSKDEDEALLSLLKDDQLTRVRHL